MVWSNYESNKYCKESYSLQIGSDSKKGFLKVCLKNDGAVRISYNDKSISEVIYLGVRDDGNSQILDKHFKLCDYDINFYEKSIYDKETVPAIIYENRRHLLEIGSGKILKAIYDFAINGIEKMEKQK